MAEQKVRGRDLMGKVVVSEETGRKFGIVGDVSFITESGELMNIVMVESTKHVHDLQLAQNDKGQVLIPFSAVRSVGDFIIIAEKDII
ncbi:MAG: PRC-barrel domain-containing protein [Nanoarchaeota archaeon]|nr:PRC-barrel domain-containing protein [Nanoarchaeota archaeon]